MSRDLTAGGEVDGSAQEWGGSSGGNALTPARALHVKSSSLLCPLSSFWQDSVAYV